MNRFSHQYPRSYSGVRRADGVAVVRVTGGDKTSRPLRLHLAKCNHSPDGVEWGYGGSGPAQLAFEILYDVFQDTELALRLHQKFKWDRIAKLPQEENWTMTEGEVVTWAARITKAYKEE